MAERSEFNEHIDPRARSCCGCDGQRRPMGNSPCRSAWFRSGGSVMTVIAALAMVASSQSISNHIVSLRQHNAAAVSICEAGVWMEPTMRRNVALRLRGGAKEGKEEKKKEKVAKKEAVPDKKKEKKDHTDEYANIIAPKRSMSSYMLFANDIRSKVAAENPELKMTQLSTVIGERWKKLSAEEKMKYDKLATKAKAEYEKEKAEYEAKVPANVRKERAIKKKKKGGKDKKTKDKDAPKKPMSAFQLYSNKVRDSVKKETPDLSFGDLSRKLSEGWKALSPNEKKVFEKDAATLKEKHLIALSQYKKEKASAEVNQDDEEEEDE